MMIKSRYQATPGNNEQQYLPPVSGESRDQRSAVKQQQSYLSNYARDNLVNNMRSQQSLDVMPSGQRGGQGIDMSHRSSMQVLQMGSRELSHDGHSAEGRMRSMSPVLNNNGGAMRGVD